MTVRVVIVDDQPPFRAAAASVLELIDGFEVVSTAPSAEDFLSMLDDVPPDIVIMDINLPGMDGVAATRQLLERCPGSVVVLVSTYSEFDLPPGAATSGARAYVHKERFDPDLIEQLWLERHSVAWRTA